MESPLVQYQKFGRNTLYIFISKKSALILMAWAAFGVILYLSSFSAQFAGIANIAIFGSLLIAIIVTALAVFMGWLEYSHYRIEIYKDFIRIRRGVLMIEEIGVPYKRIKEIKIEHSLSDQFLGLANIYVTVLEEEDGAASSGKSMINLPYIPDNLATEIQNTLLERSNIQEMVMSKPTNP